LGLRSLGVEEADIGAILEDLDFATNTVQESSDSVDVLRVDIARQCSHNCIELTFVDTVGRNGDTINTDARSTQNQRLPTHADRSEVGMEQEQQRPVRVWTTVQQYERE
jgi:hypothetical protein